MLGHYDQAITWGLQLRAMVPDAVGVVLGDAISNDAALAIAYTLKGMTAEGRASAADDMRKQPGLRVSEIEKFWTSHAYAKTRPTVRDWVLQKALPTMRLAGIRE